MNTCIPEREGALKKVKTTLKNSQHSVTNSRYKPITANNVLRSLITTH
jgi:hypothetical protein